MLEKITIWNPPYHLVFDILEQPKPMNEISLYDIEPSHLDHFFSSKTGELKLSELPNGNTLLEGSSWYQLNMEPSYYWHTITDKIIQRIHMRAFKQIKYESEKEHNQ